MDHIDIAVRDSGDNSSMPRPTKPPVEPYSRTRRTPAVAARAGLQLSLNRLMPNTVTYSRGDQLLKSYLFLEAQYFSTEKDGTDLGGNAWLLGLRLEF